MYELAVVSKVRYFIRFASLNQIRNYERDEI